jgi:hypothetical protein
VGYAFVNFIDVADVYKFASTKLGTPWNVHASAKCLEMCFAAYQYVFSLCFIGYRCTNGHAQREGGTYRQVPQLVRHGRPGGVAAQSFHHRGSGPRPAGTIPRGDSPQAQAAFGAEPWCPLRVEPRHCWIAWTGRGHAESRAVPKHPQPDFIHVPEVEHLIALGVSLLHSASRLWLDHGRFSLFASLQHYWTVFTHRILLTIRSSPSTHLRVHPNVLRYICLTGFSYLILYRLFDTRAAPCSTRIFFSSTRIFFTFALMYHAPLALPCILTLLLLIAVRMPLFLLG